MKISYYFFRKLCLCLWYFLFSVFMIKSRCTAKPNVSPPGCATNRFLRPVSPMQLVQLILPYANAIYRPNVTGTQVCGRNQQKWLLWQRSLMNQKTNFRLIIRSHRSTNPGNLAKIGPVDLEIIGLTEGIAPGAARRYAPPMAVRLAVDLAYVRPRTGPQSAHG